METTVCPYSPALDETMLSDILSGVVRIAPPENARRRRDAILVVDDDFFIQRLVERTLLRGRYSALVASSTAEALRLAEEHRSGIALVLLDLWMPGMTGHELGKQLASQCPDAKQLYMSGFAPPPGRGPALSEAEFIRKPFSSTQLLEHVQRLLEG